MTGLIVSYFLIIYLGSVIGLLYRCENIEELQHARKGVIYVPLLLFFCFFSFLFDSIKEKNPRKIILYLQTPDKSVVMLSCYEKLYRERRISLHKSRQTKPTMKKTAAIAKDLLNASIA